MSNVKMKAYYNKSKGKIIERSTAEYNKEEIFKCITERQEGIYPHKIAKKLGLVRQTVHTHLKELLKEKRIYKKNRKYFAPDWGINSINLFARVVKDSSWRLIDADLIEPSKELVDFIYSSRSQSTAYGELLKKVHGISVSSNFCETKFIPKENLNEKCLFEFASRIGALIAYVFIESMRPFEKNIAPAMSHHKRRILASSDLIHTGIDIDGIFGRFCLLFKQTGLLNITDPRSDGEEKPSFFELEKNDFDKLSEIFKRVYPGLYEGLENFWLTSRQKWLKTHTSFARKENCDHKWEETFIYKYKFPSYLCRKCHLLADSPVISEIKEEKKKK